ncbi:pesticin C-terminus-like muramidase [Roseateles sp. BYS78W]|uniref:Pesticin C-terminus-like muramidase n=1 Tax=Pelomonas candidula TaxID=3299025 RepID=A0ABW7HIK3_9BURK
MFNNEGLRLTGYWPGGKSGVTIGYGVDLSTVKASDLSNWGVSQAGINALTPVLGLAGTAASNAVAAGAPAISNADALAASNGVFNKNIGIAVGQFNAQSAIPFDSLPANVQTAVADIAFMTPYLQTAAPKFFSDIVSGNWSSAVSELLNWNGNNADPNLARHQRDANLINSQISANTIPGASTCQK